MWSQIVPLLLVSLVSASQIPAWDRNYEYTYLIQARSLVSLDEISSDYSGILLRSKLHINPRSDGNLDAKLSQPEYAQFQDELEESWKQEIPESALNFQQLKLSNQPFQIELENGVIRNVIVSKELSNWEANIIKSFVSQFQLDTQANNLIDSAYNILPARNSDNAVFKTMEETITGVSETLYDIHPFPIYLLRDKPDLVYPMDQKQKQAKIYEVVKTKNFTNSVQIPSYHFGLHGVSDYEPDNQVGSFLSRSSVTVAVITGSLEDYTIQNLNTVEEFFLTPTFSDLQKGSLHTYVNVTLMKVVKQQQNDNNVVNPVEVGLVYGYADVFGQENDPRSLKPFSHIRLHNSGESSSSSSSEESRVKRSLGGYKSPRNDIYSQKSHESSSSSSSEESLEDWHQNKPNLQEAPQTPLLPFTVGYDGQSIKKQQNIVELVQRLAEKIGHEFQQPEQYQEENTVGKYVVLTSLVRIMNMNEMKEVAERLYSQGGEGSKAGAWVAFRDALAQAGTGPALSTIKELILNDKLGKSEAATVLGTAANSVRQPTEEYMKFFFEMVQNPRILERRSVNASAILSFSKLVHEVYSDKDVAHNKFPVHSFGPFRTPQMKSFVISSVIPYFEKQLHQAVADGNTVEIHTYIRALGNVGHPLILKAFEPYLESTKEASQFQRVLMILALDKLVESYPKIARSVTYRIYQNPNELDQLRVAAVYQLMRTKPSPSMLQRMAVYTEEDGSSYVSAAVKSSIESAAQLNGEEYQELREGAQAAQPLLTSEEYGAQYSQQYLRNYLYEDDSFSNLYEQNSWVFGGKDYALPKGISQTLKVRFGGVEQHMGLVQSMVSSVEDLFSVIKVQTKKYQEDKMAKQQANPQKFPWSSEYVANLLNMQNTEREQLEGYLYLRMHSLQKIFSYTNITLNNLSEIVKDLEEELNQGKQYSYEKMIMLQEVAIAVPTVLGLPFIYTYDVPTIAKIQGNVQLRASPGISDGQYLRRPESVTAELKLRASYAGKIQSQFSIITPFDHKRYTAAFDKNIQVDFPLTGRLSLSLKDKQSKIEFDVLKDIKGKLFHISSIPYTTKGDIYNPKPDMKIIQSKTPVRIHEVFGEKSIGLAFELALTTDKPIDLRSLYQKIQQGEGLSVVLGPWIGGNIQYFKLNFAMLPEKSSTEKIVLDLGYLHKYVANQEKKHSQKPKSSDLPSSIPQSADDSQQRQEEFMEKLQKEVGYPHIYVGDAQIAFHGRKSFKYILTAGTVKSNVDPLSKFIALLRREVQGEEPVQVYTQWRSYFPNTNGLDLDYAIQMNPESKIVGVAMMKTKKHNAKVQLEAEFSKTNERKQYLQDQPDYQQYSQRSSQADFDFGSVPRMIAEANLLDKFDVSLQYEDLDPIVLNGTYRAYRAISHYLYPIVQENVFGSSEEHDNQVKIQGQFSPDLSLLDLDISTDFAQIQADDLEINDWARDILVIHPVFHASSRLEGDLLKYDAFRPTATMNEKFVNTLDNTTYPAQLSEDWTVFLQHIPRTPSLEEGQPDQTVLQQLKQQPESYIVLVRKSQAGSSKKEIMIVVQSPKTQSRIVQVLIKGDGKVLVDNQEVSYSQDLAKDFFGGFIQVYGLPNEEVKVEIRGVLYLLSNGKVFSVSVLGSRFRDASRGLAGTFTGEPSTDFTAPEDCVVQSPEAFVDSYTVSQKKNSWRSKPKRILNFVMGRRSKSRDNCFPVTLQPGNYISKPDIGRPTRLFRQSCTRLQTQYVEQGDEICFTIRPLPICKSGCHETGLVQKDVKVHCVSKSDATTLWKKEILKGASPDFSMKHQSRSVKMEVPEKCIA